MNPLRFAVATVVLVVLCGAAGAETMTTTKDDPMTVPVSGKTAAATRTAKPWTAERQAKAQPKMPADVDPAAVRDASRHVRSAGKSGPAAATGAVVLADDAAAPIGSEAKPAADDGYWTPERLRKAKPLPTPQLPADALPKSNGPKTR